MSNNPHAVHTKLIPKKKFNEYYLYNPKYPIQVVFKLLENVKDQTLIVRGKEEDFKPNEVFKKVKSEFHINNLKEEE